jgi:hypothetical protein
MRASLHRCSTQQTVSGRVSRQTTVKRRSRIVFGAWLGLSDRRLICGFVEPMTGIEPACSAWEADSRFKQVFYIGWSPGLPANSNTNYSSGFSTPGTRIRYGVGTAVVRSRSGYRRVPGTHRLSAPHGSRRPKPSVLKIRPVSVRVRLGARSKERIDAVRMTPRSGRAAPSAGRRPGVRRRTVLKVGPSVGGLL